MISRAHAAIVPVVRSTQVSRSTPPIRRPSRRSWNSIPIPPVPNGLSSVLSTSSASRRVPQVSGLSAWASRRPGPYGSFVGFESPGLRSCVCQGDPHRHGREMVARDRLHGGHRMASQTATALRTQACVGAGWDFDGTAHRAASASLRSSCARHDSSEARAAFPYACSRSAACSSSREVMRG